MTALSLLNRRLNSFEPIWVQEAEALTPAHYGFYSQFKFLEDTSVWQLTLEAAGVTKENLKVDLKDGYLAVTGEKTKGVELGRFEKDFRIPEGVDIEKIEATFEDGILTVQLPLEAKKAPKTIAIK